VRCPGAFNILQLATWFAIGCQQTSGSNATPSVADASAIAVSAASPNARSHRTFSRHAGIGAGLFRAAHDLDLAAAQQGSLETIESLLGADDQTVRKAMSAFRADLAAGVKAASLDTAKLTADEEGIEKAIADHRAKEAEALDSLHALLQAPQREALVGAVRARRFEHESRMTAWLSAKDADGGTTDWTKRRLDRLTADLLLEPSQERQVAAILTKAADLPNTAAFQSRWERRRQQTEALLSAFASDTFDAKTQDLSVLPGKSAHEPMDRMVTLLSKLAPILYPIQRDKLAASLGRPFGGVGPARRAIDDLAFPFTEPIEPEDQPPSVR
jgi:Spy/CpxP family protein refolding chaperone